MPIVVPLLVVGLLALAGSGGGSGGASGEPPDSAGLQDMRAIMDAAQLPDDWQIFLAAVAWHESKWHSDVALGPNDHPGRPPWCRRNRESVSLQNAEARAAAAIYKKNAARIDSKWPAVRFGFGSGGWFGLLPAVGVINGFFATPEWIPEVDPWDVCDPVVSVVMAVGLARGLTRWRSFADGGGTWLVLDVGWGSPGAMDSFAAQEDKRDRFGAALDALGVDRSFMDRRVSQLGNFPKGAHLLERIEAALGLSEAAA